MKLLALLLTCLPCFAQFPYSGVAWKSTSQAGGFNNVFTNVSGLYIELLSLDSTNWTGTVNESAAAARWLDLSGAGNDVTNGSANPPAYTAAIGPNGYYAVNFANNAGGIRYLKGATVDLESNCPNTIICVATETSSAGGNTLYDCATGSREILRIGTAQANIYAGINVALPAFANTGNWFLFSTVHNGFNTVVRTNGVTCKGPVNPGGFGMGQLQLGEQQEANFSYKGKMAAFLAYNRALRTNELCYVENQLISLFNLGYTVSSNGFDAGSVWADRVVVNGGAYPSDNSKVAITTFAESVSAAGLVPVSVGVYDTNNLIAAITPIIGSAGSDPWVNHNFVTGDLSINGLKGNGSTKYLDTGVTCNTAFSANNTSITIYLYTIGTTGSPLDCGAQDGSANAFTLYPADAGTTFHDTYTFNAGGRISVATTSPFYGYYCGTRTSTTAANIYWFYSGHAHSSIASIATSNGSLPALKLFLFNLNLSGSPLVGGWSDSCQSFAGFWQGLSSTKSASLSSAVQAVRTSLGGGFR